MTRSYFASMLLLLSGLVCMAGAVTTTMTTARGRYQTDDWNVSSNWDQGVPSGSDDAVISSGISATVDGLYDGDTIIPPYYGTLTIGENALLRLESTNAYNAVAFVSLIRLQRNAILGTNVKYTLNLPPIEMTSSAAFFKSLSTGAHWRTTNFNSISGGGVFTVAGVNGATYNFNSATTIAGLILAGPSRHHVYGKASGCFGTGNVKVDALEDGQSAQLHLTVNDTIDDDATLELNGNGFDKATQARITIYPGVVEAIRNLIIDGEQMTPRTYTKADGFIDNDGILIVRNSPTTTTTTTTALQCQGQCYAAWSTPWTTKCYYVEDPWDGSRPDYPCRGCRECETKLCESDCHASFNISWEAKCSYEEDPWDSSRLKYPCRGCNECETAMCQSQCRWPSIPTSWDAKCSYVEDPWDVSRPNYPCRGCVECDTAMCQGQCYAAWSTPWEKKCAFVNDVWDGSRPDHPCSGCPECLALQSEPFQLTIKVHPIRVGQVLDTGKNHEKVCLALATEAQVLSTDAAGVVITVDGTLKCTDPSRCRGFGYEGKDKQGKRVLTMKDCANSSDYFYFETQSHWPSRLILQGDGRCVQAIRVSYSINLLILDECSDGETGQQFFFLQDKKVWGTVPGQRVPVENITLAGHGPDGASDQEWAEIFRRYSGNMITVAEAARLTTVKWYEEGKHANACVAWRPPKGDRYPQMLFSASSCDEHVMNTNSWGRRFYLAPEGECRGNDSRCAGAPRKDCALLQNQSADCWWDIPDYSGVCIGTDSRCDGTSKAVCERLMNEGASCRWEDIASGPSPSEGGECIGNDSRCLDSSKAECTLLGLQGAVCKFIETPSPSPSPSPSEPGKCAGNDSRCAGSTKEVCESLQNEEADCNWETPGTTPTPSPTPREPGACMGNDSKCDGSSQAQCIHLQNEGSDCLWQASVTTSRSPSEPGSCVGNDSRCGGKDQLTCTFLGSQGSDCFWEVTQVVEAGCRGNDSRCPDSSHAKCVRLKEKESADCWWETPNSTSSGICAGHDSRCSGSSKQFCLKLEGSDCKWREDYSLVGSLGMEVMGLGDGMDVAGGVVIGFSQMLGLSGSDISVGPLSRRLLQVRRLSEPSNVFSLGYAIVVDSDVPSSFALTGDQMAQLLHTSNKDNINAAIVSGLQGMYFASDDLNVTVKEVGDVDVATLIVETSTSEETATSSSISTSFMDNTTGATTTRSSDVSLESAAIFQIRFSYLFYVIAVLLTAFV